MHTTWCRFSSGASFSGALTMIGENMNTIEVVAAECNQFPGHSRCVKKIEKGTCPTATAYTCCSGQRKHGTAADLQRVQHDHFIAGLRRGEHLKPFPEPTAAQLNEVL